MLEGSTLTSPDMLVVTTNFETNAFELFTINSLINRHLEKKEQPFPKSHPLLPFYWKQLHEFDPESEKLELERLNRIANIVNPITH
jgi:hypothetical protein